MPITKTLTTDFGISPNHWKVGYIKINYRTQTVEIFMDLWTDSTAEANGHKPLNELILRRVKDRFVLSGAQAAALLNALQNKTKKQFLDTVEQAMINNLPEFTDGILESN